jgi:hypothetical protein
MTMYLPNRDIRPTGYEAGEFLEIPTAVPAAEPNVEAHDARDDEDGPS